jgi:ribonucleoside-diphosphate reductase beta chain
VKTQFPRKILFRGNFSCGERFGGIVLGFESVQNTACCKLNLPFTPYLVAVRIEKNCNRANGAQENGVELDSRLRCPDRDAGVALVTRTKRQKMNTISIKLGEREFVLDREKAEAAQAGKQVINGRETMAFNLLPLKYTWAYELYRKMKANHWEPEDIPMQRDVEQWRSDTALSDVDRWVIRMAIGYFSAAEGIVGDNILHVVREEVTASELKLVLGRHAHEENIHADSLLYMISSLGINPHECEAMFEDVATIKRKNEFLTRVSHDLRRDMDLTQTREKQKLAKNIFMFGQCMEGTQFYGLFGMVLSLYRQGKIPGIGQMFRYTLRDESNHIEVFRQLLMELVDENPDIWTEDFKIELVETMKEAVALEKEFIKDCLPVAAVGLSAEEFMQYIDYIADRRLEGCGLPELNPGIQNPLPWLAELMDMKKEQNFFEGRVTEYQKSSALASVSDDEL